MFLDGTGRLTSNGVSAPVFVAGWVGTYSGILSAMHLIPINSKILTDSSLVKCMAMQDTGSDSFIAGGLQVGSNRIDMGRDAYLMRINALYKTVLFCVRYKSKSNTVVHSAVKAMLIENTNVYLLLDVVRDATTTASFAVLKVNAISGTVTQQTSVYIPDANISCNSIVGTTLSLVLTCAVRSGLHSAPSVVLQATQRDLSFRKLPIGWSCNSTITYVTMITPFKATSFSAPMTSVVIPTAISTHSTWQPTIAPTILLSARPSLRPSTHPSIFLNITKIRVALDTLRRDSCTCTTVISIADRSVNR